MAKKTFVVGDQLNAADLNAILDWQLIDSQAYSGGATTFTGLSSWGEILVVFDSVTAASSNPREVQVSSDNGSSYYAAAGDYIEGTSNSAGYLAVGTATTGAVNGFCHIMLFNKAVRSPVVKQNSTGGLIGAIVNQAVALNAIQVGTGLNGGTVYIYGR